MGATSEAKSGFSSNDTAANIAAADWLGPVTRQADSSTNLRVKVTYSGSWGQALWLQTAAAGSAADLTGRGVDLLYQIQTTNNLYVVDTKYVTRILSS